MSAMKQNIDMMSSAEVSPYNQVPAKAPSEYYRFLAAGVVSLAVGLAVQPLSMGLPTTRSSSITQEFTVRGRGVKIPGQRDSHPAESLVATQR